MSKFMSRSALKTLFVLAAISGLSACSSTDQVMSGSTSHNEGAAQQFVFKPAVPQFKPTAFMEQQKQREADRKKKLAKEAAKKKSTAKKRQLAAAKEKRDREAKRLATFDKLTKALNAQQKKLLNPQRESIVKRKQAAEKEIAKLTPRPVYRAPKGVKGGGSTRINALIAKHARANGVPLKLAHAVVRVESSYRPNARGAAGEIGLMQLKLSTARMMGYKGSAKALYHPENNIKYGMKYLGKARKLAGGSTCGTILRYNAGHGAKRMNPISQRYCNRVRRYI